MISLVISPLQSPLIHLCWENLVAGETRGIVENGSNGPPGSVSCYRGGGKLRGDGNRPARGGAGSASGSGNPRTFSRPRSGSR